VGSRVLFPLTAIVLIGIFAALSLAEVGTESSGVDGRITDDDGGAPMFSVPALRPGERVTNCIEVKYDGTKDAPVTLAGRGSGALDQYLDVEVERGSGGGYNNCAGFAGTRIFVGTLADFLRTGDSADSALPAWTASESEPARTFRISVALREVAAAEGQTAAATFEWAAPGVDETADPDDPDSSPVPPPVAGQKPKSKPKPSLTESTDPSQRADSRTPGKDGGNGAAGGGGGYTSGGGGEEKSLLDKVTDIAVESGKRLAFPSILALLAFLFLLVQNRLDRRDPKLSEAPLHRDDDLLPFGPLPWARVGAQ
jgi:hypothetical protein